MFIRLYVRLSSNAVGVLTRKLQGEAGRGGFFGDGGMTSYEVAIRHHKYWGLQSHTRQQKTSQKGKIAVNKK